eukprot:TRINITY_DN46794_c0_g1_i1.p1 TRINITY_DN46794_c0_g1~~TRINITY_DN46794_c0_g1_i1.p1  ORF type:complete len:247 (+),score=59.94 TRINITY_DN46794_c0_g1_i1:43-741(+)
MATASASSARFLLRRAAAATAVATGAAAATLPLRPVDRSAAACSSGDEGRNRFELINKDKFLKAKLAASTDYVAAACGMRYCDLKVGRGSLVVERGMMVGIHFEGFRLNGRQLESTWGRGPNPVFIEAGNSPDFPALGEGVLGMSEGGRRELVVPPRMNREGVAEVTTYIVDVFAVASAQPSPAPKAATEASSSSSSSPAPAGEGGEVADGAAGRKESLWGRLRRWLARESA